MGPAEVRGHMEKAGVYLVTSDFNEGWGAVLNESMNSGCAVVASHAAGAVPFLMKHGENGLVYENGNAEDLYRKVKAVLLDPERQRELGRNAYRTVTELWNANTAAERFMIFAQEIEEKGYCDLFDDGPCSPAPIIKNNWFKEKNYDVSWI
jgi:glycosyltransferase involved in cell wall biosynthesis